MTPIDKIYLVGFMAAGKTTVARAIARRLGWRAEDVDELIEARERLTVADIFARHGEPYFRTVEREILQLLLPLRHTVVATGGGTFMDPESQQAIRLDGASVWLDVPLETIVARLPLGRPPPALVRPGADGTAVRDAAGRLRARATCAWTPPGPQTRSRSVSSTSYTLDRPADDR